MPSRDLIAKDGTRFTFEPRRDNRRSFLLRLPSPKSDTWYARIRSDGVGQYHGLLVAGARSNTFGPFDTAQRAADTLVEHVLAQHPPTRSAR